MHQGPDQSYTNEQMPLHTSNIQPGLPPQEPRSFKQWFDAQSQLTKASFGCGVLFLAVILCGFSLGIVGHFLIIMKTNTTAKQDNVGQSTANSSHVSMSLTLTPTTSPSPTPTPLPTISLHSAILGGSVNAFDKKFGANNCCYENGWDPPTGPYVAVSDETYASNIDEASLNRVVHVYIRPQSDGNGGTPTWDGPTASKLCNTYLPPDAVYQSGYQVFLANLVAGYTKVYYSPLLAHTLPAKDFTDKDDKQGKPGTIYVYFSYHYDADHIDHCTLGIRGKDDLEG